MTTPLFFTSAESEIASTRVVPFSQELVFRAWSEPEHLKNWWGPEGFTNTFHEFDFRESGKWVFTMHGPEKGNYENECEFVKIDKPNSIAWKRISKPLFKVVATFEKISEQSTKVVFRMVFDSAEECNKLKPYVVDKNEENFDKLEVELANMKV